MFSRRSPRVTVRVAVHRAKSFNAHLVRKAAANELTTTPSRWNSYRRQKLFAFSAGTIIVIFNDYDFFFNLFFSSFPTLLNLLLRGRSHSSPFRRVQSFRNRCREEGAKWTIFFLNGISVTERTEGTGPFCPAITYFSRLSVNTTCLILGKALAHKSLTRAR